MCMTAHSYQWRLCEAVSYGLVVPHAYHDLWELWPLEHVDILCKNGRKLITATCTLLITHA